MERRQQSKNQSDNLWRNYKNLLFLEESRDRFFNNARQKFSDDEVEYKALGKCSLDVENQSEIMFDQIKNVFQVLHELTAFDHHLLETCVKIVDMEEGRDVESALENEEGSPCIVPGRPKRWRRQCLDLIESEVSKRVTVTAAIPPSLADDKEDTWLLLSLTKVKGDTQKDLKHAQELGGIFTSAWDMCNTYCRAYYNNLMLRMEQRFSFELNHKETVEVLSWMIHCRDRVFKCTNIDCGACQIIVKLQEKYMSEKREQVHDWMGRALVRDIDNWNSSKARPGCDLQNTLYTGFPIDILSLLQANMNQAKDISAELHRNISKLCLEELEKVMESYASHAKSYIGQEPEPAAVATTLRYLHPALKKKKPTAPRPAFYVQYAVALINNFDKITTSLQEIKPEYDAHNEDTTDCRNNNNKEWKTLTVEGLIHKVKTQTKECSDMFLPKLQEDMSGDLATLLTRNWLLGNEKEAVDTMCEVMTSYLHQLREPLRSSLIPEIEIMFVTEYIRGLTEKRVQWEGREKNRLEIHAKVYRECQQFERLIQDLKDDKKVREKSPWDIVRSMAEVLTSNDEGTLITIVIVIASTYPILTRKQAQRLLKLRGDLTKAQINHITSSSLGKKGTSIKRTEPDVKTTLSKLYPA